MSIVKKDLDPSRENHTLKNYIETNTKVFVDALKNAPGNLHQRVFDSMKTIFENILHNPYLDFYRVVDTYHYPLTKAFKLQAGIDYLKSLGFLEGKNPKQLYFPYDAMLASLSIADEFLKTYYSKIIAEKSSSDIKNKVSFPFFKKFTNILSADLLNKASKEERIALNVTLDELQSMSKRMKSGTLQELIVEYGTRPENFQQTMEANMANTYKLKQLLTIVHELWLESNVIHKFGVYLSQCFADYISKTQLTLKDNVNAQLVRQSLEIDIMQAMTLTRLSDNKILTLQDIVHSYIRWLPYRNEGNGISNLETIIEKSLFSKEKAKRFFEILEQLICERVSADPRKRRGNIDSKSYQQWIQSPPPNLEPADLPIDTRRKIQEMATEIITQSTEPDDYPSVGKQKRTLQEKIKELVWDPRIWLNQGELLFDYNFYMICNNLCNKLGFNLSLDSEEEFKSMMKGSRPVEKELVEDPRAQTLDNDNNFEDKEVYGYLYRKSTPAILHAIIFNKHRDLLLDYLKKGAYVNIRDHRKWTPLHVASHVGSAEIASMLLEFNADMTAVEEQGRTPFDLALESGSYQGELSVCSVLIEKGYVPKEQSWERLLQYSLDKDVTCYVRAAHLSNFFLQNFGDPKRFSLHKAIRYQAKKIIETLINISDHNFLRSIATMKDFEGKTALELAEAGEDYEILKMISNLVGQNERFKYDRIVEDHQNMLQENNQSYQATINALNYDQYFSPNKGKRGIQPADSSLDGLPSTTKMFNENPRYNVDQSRLNPIEQGRRLNYAKIDNSEFQPPLWQETQAKETKNTIPNEEYYRVDYPDTSNYLKKNLPYSPYREPANVSKKRILDDLQDSPEPYFAMNSDADSYLLKRNNTLPDENKDRVSPTLRNSKTLQQKINSYDMPPPTNEVIIDSKSSPRKSPSLDENPFDGDNIKPLEKSPSLKQSLINGSLTKDPSSKSPFLENYGSGIGGIGGSVENEKITFVPPKQLITAVASGKPKTPDEESDLNRTMTEFEKKAQEEQIEKLKSEVKEQNELVNDLKKKIEASEKKAKDQIDALVMQSSTSQKLAKDEEQKKIYEIQKQHQQDMMVLKTDFNQQLGLLNTTLSRLTNELDKYKQEQQKKKSRACNIF